MSSMSGVGKKGISSGKPLVQSEKHDILYSKARFVLNQRHIKRPWFNINPFLDNIDNKVDLEHFQPEESKFVQRLESLVLCENFQHNQLIDTKETPIDKFFEYLYSDSWKKGCSLRILEGQLLDEVLLGLYRLETSGQTVSHTTYAIANNSRTRHGCYKLANKEAYGSIEETLLLEFVYFGRLTKQTRNTKTLNTFEYLGNDLKRGEKEEMIDKNMGEEKHPDTDDDITETDKSEAVTVSPNSPSTGIGRLRGINLTLPTDTINETLLNYRKGSSTCTSMLVPANAVRFAVALASPKKKSQNKRLSPESWSVFTSAPITLQRDIKTFLESRRNTAPKKTKTDRRSRSPHSSEDSSDESEDDFDESRYVQEETKNTQTSPSSVADSDFGEELLLSDLSNKPKKPLSTKQLLKKKQEELHVRRIEAKQEKAKPRSKEAKFALPPLEELDYSTIKYETIRMSEEVPTLEEFVQLLKDDEYYDPRYRNKVRIKGRRLAQRYYYLARSHGRNQQLDSIQRLPNIAEKNISGRKPTTSKQSVVQPTKSELRRQRYKQSFEVLGITDSEPCKSHYYAKKGQRDTKDDKPNTCTSKQKLDAKSQGQLNKDVDYKRADSRKSRRHSRESAQTTEISSYPVQRTKHSPQCLIKIQAESPTVLSDDQESDSLELSPSDSGTDEDEPSTFNINKLNLKYSFERLKKKRKIRAIKKKPAFLSILSKYYNMQNATSSSGRTTPSVKKSKQVVPKIKKLNIFDVAKEAKKRATIITPVVGKLKKFSFQDKVPPKERLNLEEVDQVYFQVPDLKTFHKQLAKALDDFVVRREVVVSSLHSFFNSTKSVTFTKVTCFEQTHKH